jgi:hypothetical protein
MATVNKPATKKAAPKPDEVQGDISIVSEPRPIMESPTVHQATKLIEMAVTQGASTKKLSKLLDLKERYEKEEARKAYTAAMAAFKTEDIEIKKDRLVEYPHRDDPTGKTSYRHASLGNIVNIAVPKLAAHGLSHKWESKREGDRVEVRCVMTHRDGHSEATEWWPGPLDNSGKKNPIQQAASTVTYLERYTFLMITGLAVEDQDDDGNTGMDETPPVKMISEEEVNQVHAMITENELDMDVFMNWLKTVQKCASIEEIPVAMLAVVTDKLNKAIKAKK